MRLNLPVPLVSPARRAAPFVLLLLAAPLAARAQAAPPPTASPSATAEIRVVSDRGGLTLDVDGRPFLVRGVNWDYFPIGTNYSYSLWNQPDDVIEAALENEMPLMKRMGVNAVRLYAGVPPRWVRYIYEHYGIWTVLNHTVGRYGYTLDGAWVPTVDYSDPHFREVVKKDIADLVKRFEGTPGLLMWLLGNENNYGLSWSSFEIEALPVGERQTARARYLYSLFGEIIQEVKAEDPRHPVAIANGDLQYVDLVAEECPGLDVFGANVYRGASMGDLYQVVKEKLGLPVMFTEFGADAYDAKRHREDDVVQARYLLAQWKEIYEQSAGKGGVGNAIGGFIFQWSDGWWKYKQDTNLELHDTNASWPNGGYREDYVEGENNMNEEWWGICAKGPADAKGLYPLYPRTTYYVLQEAFRLPPYGPATGRATIERHFDAIVPAELAFHYQAAQSAAGVARLEKVHLSDVRLSFETYSTGGNDRWQRAGVPNGGKGFDHTESVFLAATLHPTERVTGSVALNVLGNVAQNPIDELFYERRAKPIPVYVQTPDPYDPTGQATVEGFQPLRILDRARIYAANVTWDEDRFRVDGFFRTGHYHWANEGDVFGLYREANYGAAADIYDADVPIGLEVTGKRELSGLKLAFGPQLWWGANPTVMAKYRLRVGDGYLTLLHQEDLAEAGATGVSSVIPMPATRKTTLAWQTRLFGVDLELAGIFSGSNFIGESFLDARDRPQQIAVGDTFGARAKVVFERGPWHWYAQGAYMGLVAEAGPDPRVTFTGWSLKDSGSGNQVNAMTGLAVNLGLLQIGPNVLWQKPLVGPGHSILDIHQARNIDADPFVVRANRETLAGELMLVLDPTPGTWMWAWDNDLREDAPLAGSIDLVYRHQPTGVDAGVFFAPDGVTRFAFPAGVPAADVYEVNVRVVSAPRPDLRLVLHGYAGNQQPNGDSPRQPHRYGGDLSVAWGALSFAGFAKFNDWGPYDYYRDFNLTYPLQLMGDLAWTLGPVRWLWQEQTKIGIRATSRYLNGYSGGRYVPDPADPRAWGHEYEIRTYLVVTL